MERAAFLLEQTGERIGCLLNPETIVVRRTAGVVRRQLGTGPLTGTGLSDDPLLFTGGGRTEITMELLFDVTLAGSSITTDDVRGLTGPLWGVSRESHNRGGIRRAAYRSPCLGQVVERARSDYSRCRAARVLHCWRRAAAIVAEHTVRSRSGTGCHSGTRQRSGGIGPPTSDGRRTGGTCGK